MTTYLQVLAFTVLLGITVSTSEISSTKETTTDICSEPIGGGSSLPPINS